jgi:hypothetical protein
LQPGVFNLRYASKRFRRKKELRKLNVNELGAWSAEPEAAQILQPFTVDPFRINADHSFHGAKSPTVSLSLP